MTPSASVATFSALMLLAALLCAAVALLGDRRLHGVGVGAVLFLFGAVVGAWAAVLCVLSGVIAAFMWLAGA